MKEVWRDVVVPDKPEYSELYQVSSVGRVRAKSRVVVRRLNNGIVGKQHRKPKLLTPTKITSTHRYALVRLKLPSQKHLAIGVHWLVALAFIGSPPTSTAVVMHKDDNPANCCYRNLKWGASQLDNIADRQAKGRQSKGARQAAAKLTDRKVLAIRKLLSSGVSQRVIARKFQISAPVVSRINTGQAWAHVQGDA